MKLYAVRDEISEQFGSIGFATNHRAAMREFLKQIADGNLSETEYQMYYLGEFDMETGEIDPVLPTPMKELIIPEEDIDQKIEEIMRK